MPGEDEPQWLVTAIAEAQVGADYDAEAGHFAFPDPARRWPILVDSNGRFELFIWREPDGGTHQHGASTRAVSWYVRR